MNAEKRQAILAEEWMMDAHNPLPMLARLHYRGTYSQATLWWLVVQFNLLSRIQVSPEFQRLTAELGFWQLPK
ncbi:MAG: hypothetical protein Q6J68_00745 [Thermostichales cyanobacterium SZTDM-1c_bins_54]